MFKCIKKKIMFKAKYCKKCGKKLLCFTDITKYDSKTGKPIKRKVVFECPEFYANALDDNGHFHMMYTEKVKDETD